MERGTGAQSRPARILRGLRRGEAVALTAMLLILASLAGPLPAWAATSGTVHIACLPPQVVSGEEITCNITITNLGSAKLTMHDIAVTIPSGYTYISGSTVGLIRTDPVQIVSGTARTLDWRGLESLSAPSQQLVLSFRMLAGAAPGVFDIRVQFNTSPALESPRDETPVEVEPLADLSVKKTASSGTLIAGDPASTGTFTLTAHNAGPDTAAGVVVTDTLPPGLSFVSGAGCAAVPGTNQVRCEIGNLQRDAGAVRTITVRADAPAQPGVTANSAVVTGDAIDPNPGNNRASATVTVERVSAVSVTKTGPPVAQAGDDVTYTVTITNTGPSAAETTLQDVLPAGLTATEISGPGCVLERLACMMAVEPGVPVKVTVTAASSPGIPDGTSLTNTATITTETKNTSETTEASFTTTFGGNAVLTLDKALVSETPIVAGTVAEYSLTVHNAGPSAAAGVIITDTLPAGTTLDTTGTAGDCAAGSGNQVSCEIGMLAAGETRTVAIAVSVPSGTPQGAELTNTATLSSTTGHPPVGEVTVTDPVTRQADLQIVKTATPAAARPGEAITYTLTVTNRGPSDASGVEVTDQVPPGITGITAATGPGTCSVAGATVTCAAGTLAADATDTVTITGTVAPGTPAGPLMDNANVTATEDDPNLLNNHSIAATNVEATDALSLSKSASSDPAAAGAPLQYTLTVTNNGGATASDVKLTDELPAGYTAFSASASSGGTCTIADGSVKCQLGNILAGDDVTVTITGRVAASLPAGTELTNAATAVSAEGTSTKAESILSVVRSSGITITKIPAEPAVTAGTLVTWYIRVSNGGPSDASDLTVFDSPSGFELTGLSGNGATCAVAERNCVIAGLPAGGSVTITATGDVPADADGSVTNTATVRTPEGQDGSATSTVPVERTASLHVTKTGPDKATPGETISYVVTVSNKGPSTATGVAVNDALPPGLTFAGPPNSSQGCSSTDGSHVTCDIGTLQAPSSDTSTAAVVIGATVDVTATGTLANTAVATDDEGSTAQDSATTGVAPQADLSVAKTSPIGIAGTDLAWTITVHNDGPAEATGVTLTDTIPDGLTYVSASVPEGTCSFSHPDVTCDFPPIGSGDDVEITLVTRVGPGLVPPGATSVMVPDTATVHPGPGNYDPTPEDNTVTVEAIITAQADLVATKSAAPDPVAAGGELTYTLGLRNTGPSNANDATVSDTLPPNVQFLAARSDQRCVLGADNTVACHAGTLAAGEHTTFRFVVLVSARLASQSMLGNVSWGDSDQFDPGDHRDSSVVITHVIRPSVTHVTGPVVPVTGLRCPSAHVPSPYVAGSG